MTNIKVDWDLSLYPDGRLQTFLDMERVSNGQIAPQQAVALQSMEGRHPCELVTQRASRERLQAIVFGVGLCVDPEVRRAVQEALDSRAIATAPLYPLSPMQRLGFVDEVDSLECKESLDPFFLAGHSYPVRTLSVAIERAGTRLNLEGSKADVQYYARETAIILKAESGDEKVFLDSPNGARVTWLRPGEEAGRQGEDAVECPVHFSVAELLDRFIIPDVEDVGRVNPEGYERNLHLLKEIEEICV